MATVVMEPDISVADAEAIINEALAYIDEQRRGLTEILTCVREEGGAFGYSLAQLVGPYVSKASCLALFRPSSRRFWGKSVPPLPSAEDTAPLDGLPLLDEDLLWPVDGGLKEVGP